MSGRRRAGGPDERVSLALHVEDLDRRRLAAALDAVSDAIVVVDAGGEVVLRNTSAGRFNDARHADALAGGALRELLDRARSGEECSRELQLFGPPAEVFWMTARPLAKWLREVPAEPPLAALPGTRSAYARRAFGQHRSGAADHRLFLWSWLAAQGFAGQMSAPPAMNASAA